jgi:hypothetical protein
MIKLVYTLDRRADVAPEDFYDYWLNSHGPRVRSHAEALKGRRYVQSHLIDTPANEGLRAPRGMLPPVAGVTEFWWDSLEDFQSVVNDPAGADALQDLAEDEAKFINIAGSQAFFTEEHPIFDHTDRRPLGPDAVKCAYLLTKRDDLTQEECHKTWLVDHGPLVASYAELLHTAKYVQSHAVAPEVNQSFVSERGFAAPLDGLTEVWLQSLSEREGEAATNEARQKAGAHMAQDEARFVEMGKSRCFMTKEHEIFNYS